MNNKAQVQSIIFFFILVVGIFLTSIIVLRMTNEIISPFKNQIGNMSAPAGEVVGEVHDKFTSWWDIFIVLLVFINVILLFVSSFMIDIHPAFVLVYIVAVMFLMILGNNALSVLDSVWGSVGTSVETGQTPITQFLINHFGLFLLGVIILSGVIMYAKFKFFGGVGQKY